jgi:sugar phosphate isomerase/epimerase
MRFGVCAWIYGDAPLEETMHRIAAAGYDSVEIPGEPSRWSSHEVRRLLDRYRLTPVALTASCMFPQTPRDLAHPDPAIRASAVRYLEDCLRFAAEIGAPLVQMLPSGETRLAPVGSPDDEWRWSVEAMRTAAVAAAQLGVRICVEPLNRYEAYLVTTVEQALRYLADVASPWVGITLDAFHANIEEAELAGAVRLAGRWLWHVHVADTNRQGLGRGHLDLDGLMGALREIQYQGAVVLEVMPPGPDPFMPIKGADSPEILDVYLRESLAHLRRAAAGGRSREGRGGRDANVSSVSV